MSTNLIHFTLTYYNKWKVQKNKLYILFCIRHILKHIIILMNKMRKKFQEITALNTKRCELSTN